MTRATRPVARLALAVVATAVAVAACGSSTGSNVDASPVPSRPADAPAVSPSAPATSTPASTASEAATASAAARSPLPTFTRVAELEALLPTRLAGSSTKPASLTGNDVLATGRPEDVAALQRILADTGATAADYGFAYVVVPGPSVAGVFRVRGADPTKVRDSLIAQGKEATGGSGSVEAGTIGGKPVQIFRATAADGTLWSSYYWPKGDLLFFVQTTDPTIAEEFFSAL